MATMDRHVLIIEYATDKVEKNMGPFTLRHAQRVEDGANINLNHEKYFTRVVAVDDLGKFNVA